LASDLRKNRKPDLIVWNETALKYPVRVFEEYPFEQSYPYNVMFPGLFESFGTHLLTGAPAMDAEKRYYNAALLVTPEGKVPQFYAKRHPVPFVESIPLYEIPFMRTFFNRVVGIYQSWTMGRETRLIVLPRPGKPPVQIGVPICFEDVFADLCAEYVRKGADVLVNLTNDSWSQTKSALTQHMAAARFRAVENRRTLVRGTNAGLTCLVQPTGAITDETPLFTESFVAADVPIYQDGSLTLYTMFTDAFPWILIVLLILVFAEDVLHFSISGIASAVFSGRSGKKSLPD